MFLVLELAVKIRLECFTAKIKLLFDRIRIETLFLLVADGSLVIQYLLIIILVEFLVENEQGCESS
jgi:hypothetical protein